jgi:hypothetical protein
MASADSSQQASDILNIVLGAGGVGFLYACAKVFNSWREGTWRRNDTAVADLERWRATSDDAREWEALQHQWWRQWAGRLEYKITSTLGPEALPPKEPYPVKPEEGHKP